MIEGRQFDAQGNLRDWWTAADAKGFKDRARADSSISSTATRVNDSLQRRTASCTQDENIADLGGLKIAYAALEQHRWREAASTRRPASRPSSSSSCRRRRIWADTARPEFARAAACSPTPHAPSPLAREWTAVQTCRSSPTRSVVRAGGPMVRARVGACRGLVRAVAGDRSATRRRPRAANGRRLRRRTNGADPCACRPAGPASILLRRFRRPSRRQCPFAPDELRSLPPCLSIPVALRRAQSLARPQCCQAEPACESARQPAPRRMVQRDRSR